MYHHNYTGGAFKTMPISPKVTLGETTPTADYAAAKAIKMEVNGSPFLRHKNTPAIFTFQTMPSASNNICSSGAPIADGPHTPHTPNGSSGGLETHAAHHHSSSSSSNTGIDMAAATYLSHFGKGKAQSPVISAATGPASPLSASMQIIAIRNNNDQMPSASTATLTATTTTAPSVNNHHSNSNISSVLLGQPVICNSSTTTNSTTTTTISSHITAIAPNATIASTIPINTTLTTTINHATNTTHTLTTPLTTSTDTIMAPVLYKTITIETGSGGPSKPCAAALKSPSHGGIVVLTQATLSELLQSGGGIVNLSALHQHAAQQPAATGTTAPITTQQPSSTTNHNQASANGRQIVLTTNHSIAMTNHATNPSSNHQHNNHHHNNSIIKTNNSSPNRTNNPKTSHNQLTKPPSILMINSGALHSHAAVVAATAAAAAGTAKQQSVMFTINNNSVSCGDAPFVCIHPFTVPFIRHYTQRNYAIPCDDHAAHSNSTAAYMLASTQHPQHRHMPYVPTTSSSVPITSKSSAAAVYSSASLTTCGGSLQTPSAVQYVISEVPNLLIPTQNYETPMNMVDSEYMCKFNFVTFICNVYPVKPVILFILL